MIVSKQFSDKNGMPVTRYGCEVIRSCGHMQRTDPIFLTSLDAEYHERWIMANGLCSYIFNERTVPPRTDVEPPRYGYPSSVRQICGAK